MRLKVMPTLAVRRPADLGGLHRERDAASVCLATLRVGWLALACPSGTVRSVLPRGLAELAEVLET